MDHEEYVTQKKAELVGLADKILTSELGIMDGTLKILLILNELDLSNLEEYLIFKVLESETDHLPRGEDKKHWNPTAFQEKEKELTRSVNFYREDVLDSCKAIVTNFKG